MGPDSIAIVPPINPALSVANFGGGFGVSLLGDTSCSTATQICASAMTCPLAHSAKIHNVGTDIEESRGGKDMCEELKVITSDSLEQRLAAGEPIVVVDVRDDWEYEDQHIPGSLLLPLEELEDRHASELEKDDPIVVVCQHGARSEEAAQYLTSVGYLDVSTLDGGLVTYRGDLDP
jgi:rhodanese-related sulfurtransferase